MIVYGETNVVSVLLVSRFLSDLVLPIASLGQMTLFLNQVRSFQCLTVNRVINLRIIMVSTMVNHNTEYTIDNLCWKKF